MNTLKLEETHRNVPTDLTIDEIFEIEPRLKQLEQEALAANGSNKNCCRNHLWFRHHPESLQLKERMSQLVGWREDNQVLGSSSTYSLVYKHLYGLLPDCKHTGPFCA